MSDTNVIRIVQSINEHFLTRNNEEVDSNVAAIATTWSLDGTRMMTDCVETPFSEGGLTDTSAP